MANRRVFCEIVSGICFEDRCLYALKKIIERSKTCEQCIVREVESLKSGSKKPKVEKMPTAKKNQPGRTDRGANDAEQPYTVERNTKVRNGK
jgi:hypothetical protein